MIPMTVETTDLLTQIARIQNIAGTRTWLSIPLAQNATLDDVLLFKPLNAKRTLGELINTLGATPFCFVYE